MSRRQNKEILPLVPVETDNTSSSGLDSSDSSLHNESMASPVAQAGPSSMHQDGTLPQGLNVFQNGMGVSQPTPRIIPHIFPQDLQFNMSRDLQLLPVHMPQHPIELHHIQEPVQPHLLAGISIKQEPLDFTRESLQQLQTQPHMTPPVEVTPSLPRAERRRTSNPSGGAGEQGDSPPELMDSNANTRDLIFSAITVMKIRKARPDAKRICSWINRRYGRSVSTITDELDRLVEVGDLARVDYKGSASFRINSPTGRPRRRRRMIRANSTSEPQTQTQSQSQTQSQPQPQSQSQPQSQTPLGGALPSSFCPGPDGSPPQLTLHLLVKELLGVSDDFNTRIPVNISTISAAVKSSSRDFVRASVLGNIEFLLEHEVDRGYFIKVDAENYFVVPRTTFRPMPIRVPMAVQRSFPQLPQLPQHPVSPGSISQESPFSNGISNLIPSLPTSPLPPHQMIPMSMSLASSQMTFPRSTFGLPSSEISLHSGLQFQQIPMNQPTSTATSQNVHQLLMQNCSFPLPTIPIPQNQSMTSSLPGGATLNPVTSPFGHQQHSYQMSQFMPNHNYENNGEKSDDQIKNDLIRYQLSKLSNKDQKMRSPGKKFTEPFLRHLEAPALQDTLEKLKSFRRKKNNGVSVMGMSHDHFNGFGSRKTQNHAPQFSNHFNQNGHASISEVSTYIPERTPSTNVELSIPDPRSFKTCVICKQGQDILSSRIGDLMLTCKNCNIRSHSSCLKLSEELTCRILNQQIWLCNSCRHCAVCPKVLNTEFALSCKHCDFRIHLKCLTYPIKIGPTGEWECQTCVSARLLQTRQPQLTVSVVTNGHHRDREILQQKLSSPKYPSDEGQASPPHSRILAKWDEFEADKTVPDISEWSPEQLSKFFAEKEFPPDVYRKFIEHEVDGCTVLIMRRQDVLDGLGLKLGKAIHIFSYVKKFQLAQAMR